MQLRKISILLKDYKMYKERYTPTKLRNLAIHLGNLLLFIKGLNPCKTSNHSWASSQPFL